MTEENGYNAAGADNLVCVCNFSMMVANDWVCGHAIDGDFAKKLGEDGKDRFARKN